jgi:hypothetical protein
MHTYSCTHTHAHILMHTCTHWCRIVGPIGSSVRVVFERQGSGEIFERTLVRGHPQAHAGSADQSFHSNAISRSMDGRGLSFSSMPAGANVNDSDVARMRSRVADVRSPPVHTSYRNTCMHTSYRNTCMHTSYRNTCMHTSYRNTCMHTSYRNTCMHTLYL